MVYKEGKKMNQKEYEELFEELPDAPAEPIVFTQEETYVFKIKPVWQFQSIEVEIKGTKKDISKVMDLYTDLLSGLMKIAPEQKRELNEAKPTIKLASEAQKVLMRKFNISFTANTTAAEAQKLIQKSVEEANK